MKEECKVYIKGVQGRGDEVIKMLVDLGAADGVCYTGENQQYLYFINHLGCVDYTSPDLEKGQIIMDCYTELHLPEKWKDGDVLITGEGLLFVLKGDYQVGDKDATIGGYCCVSEHQVCLSGHFSQIVSPRLASPSEVERFHELMHKYGKDWDAEKKQVVDWKWRPKTDERYWFVSSSGRIIDYGWTDSPADKAGFDFGNCFRTKEEAEAAAERVRKALKGE